jgi:hypothetical protein
MYYPLGQVSKHSSVLWTQNLLLRHPQGKVVKNAQIELPSTWGYPETEVKSPSIFASGASGKWLLESCIFSAVSS